MSEARKFYWLKLKDDFFEEKYIKAMRKLPDGDALVIIYLKLQLKSLKNEGIIKYDRIMPSVEEELALLLDEDVNKVKLAVKAILNMGIAELWENDTLYISAMQELIGSETSVAERVRRHRQQKALHCNADVTSCNTEIEIDKEEDKEEEIEQKGKSSNPRKRTRFTPPTLEEVQAYCKERKNNVDAQAFFDYYAEADWHDKNGDKVKSWKQKVITWEGRKGKEQKQNKNDGWCMPDPNTVDDLSDLF